MARMHRGWRHQAGFTLIELMMVVVVIAVLAAIAIPNYLEYTVRTRREAAGACLTEVAQAMERRYTECLAYNQQQNGATPPDCVRVLDAPQCGQAGELADSYAAVAFNTLGERLFTLRIAPRGAQASRDTKCGTLTLNQAGTKGESGTATNANECF